MIAITPLDYDSEMPETTRTVGPGPVERSVTTEDGKVLAVPEDWALLPPGDAALTRRVKAGGACWMVKTKRGRRVFSQGLWAPADRIARERTRLLEERADPAHARKREADARRRDRKQAAYVQEFEVAVLQFLNFAPRHDELGRQLARAVSELATPVGSGTVARTQRIPVERRAEAAVIAWLRHQTTQYDHMNIPRVKGMRREVRRMLAEQARLLLNAYRRGDPVSAARCPLARALRAPKAPSDGDLIME